MPSINDLAFKFPLSKKRSLNDKWFDYLGGQTYTSATRPDATSVPIGTIIQQTDLPGLWEASSLGWVPVNGEITLISKWGSVATPLQTLTGVTTGIFTDQFIIPANTLIADKSFLEIEIWQTRLGTGGTHVGIIYIGTGEGTANSVAANWTFAATNNLNFRGGTGMAFHTSSLTSSNYVNPGSQGTAAFVDRNTNIDITQPMKIQFGITSGNIADSYSLLGYQITLKQR